MMSRKQENYSGARRQQQRKRHGVDYSMTTLLLAFFKSMIVTAFIIATLVIAVKWYQKMQHPSAQPFAHVKLEGELVNLSKTLFMQKIITGVDKGYFALDLRTLKQTLEKEPWVYDVDLRRAWPDTLIVRVEEQVPIAFWGEGGYLNKYGEQFELRGERVPQQLPHLAGTPGREKQLIKDFLAYDEVLASVDLRLVQLSEDARLDQRLLLADGTVIALGRDRRQERVTRFSEIYGKQLGDVAANIHSLDLRYNHGFSVRWKEAHISNEATVQSEEQS